MLRSVYSALFWAFLTVSSALLFPVALSIWLVTLPFDRRKVALHRFTCFWASLYTWLNPAWPVRIRGRENFDDRVKVVATPITGSTNLTATGASAEHSDVGWNARTYGNFDFGAGGWFNVDIWLTEDGGGAQSAADIGFGYFNGTSSNTADFGGVGYTGACGGSSGAPAVFDTDGNGESWGVAIETAEIALPIHQHVS